MFVKYGFPLDVIDKPKLKSELLNHRSALEYPEHVEHYIQEEISHEAMAGPFEEPPFDLHISPFMTRDKSSSDKRRCIIDLSWPKNYSVNSNLHDDKYLGTKFVLTFPSIDHIVRTILRTPGCMIAKVDISRAFRHLPVDPRDLKFLGLHWNSYYCDLAIPFGLKFGSCLFQRLSVSIRYLMLLKGYTVCNYIDDMLILEPRGKASKAFDYLKALLQDLGLTLSNSKLVAPSTVVTCLGIDIDTVKRTFSVPSEKLAEIKKLCQHWLQKQSCMKRQLQSLLGSLLYVSKCVKNARFFLNRMPKC